MTDRLLDPSALAHGYARLRVRRIEARDPVSDQRRLLASLVAQARRTRFGQAHDFDAIDSVEAFQDRVPLRDYDAFWSDWWQAGFPGLEDVTWPGVIPWFTLTSGTTTGRSKYIPYTRAMRRAAIRGFLDLLAFHHVRNPQSRLFGGVGLGLTGPTTLRSEGPRVASGAVSAITVGAVPGFLRHRVLPPPELADLPDWRDKIRRLAPLTLERDLRFLGGSPNWILLFLEEVARVRPASPERLAEWYPNLELIVHGGLNFAPYRDRFRALLDGGHAETRELYSASEGVFAYADRGDGEGMRLHLDGQVFFEFVRLDAKGVPTSDRQWLGTVETGVDYALALTTAAGLWSYLVGDVVRFVSTDPPRITVTGRLGQGLSAFGEHLIEAEIADAIARAGAATGLRVIDYTVGPVRDGAGNRHLYLVEAQRLPEAPEAAAFAAELDAALSRTNADYEELRHGGLAISAPAVRFVAPGGFVRWMESRRALGGQNKLPRILRDPALMADMRDFLADNPGTGGHR